MSTPAATTAAPAATTTAPASSGFLSASAPAAAPTPPAATTAAPAATAAAPATGASTFFFDASLHKDGKFNEGWAGRLKEAGYERLANKGMTAPDEATFLRSIDDTLAHVGKKGIQYPTAASTPEEIADYRRSAGVPDDARAYELKPEKLPEGVEWDEAGAAEFAALLHQHHAPAALAKELGAMWANQQGKFREAAQGGFDKQIGDLAAQSAQVFGREWGEGAEARREANVDFVKARGLNLDDPVLKIALSHPDIVRFVDEARQALRGAPLPGVNEGVFTGSGSPREQAQAIMKADRNWQRDAQKAKRVTELYALQEQQDARKKR